MKIKSLLYISILCGASASAAVPSNYYSSCENTSGNTLLTRLHETIDDHTVISYDGLWELYKTTDVTASGKIWDMYSTKEWTPTERCGSYKLVGDCYNREHSLPKSWFNEASPMKSDAFHVIPTDGKVNGQRSNHPYGECENGTRLASNGTVRALGKLGACTFPGYSGTVFEPDDEYKGDMARAYFYMAARYNDKIKNWNSDMLAGNSYPVFTQWAVNMLLKWHRQDPVSQKELDRNEAVYAAQGNRNPFIDYPELAEYIWGNKVGTAWNSELEHEQAINRPVDGSTISFGVVAVNVASTIDVVIKGSNLKQAVSIAVSGTGLSANKTTVTATAANSEAGATVTLTCRATSAGTVNGTLTLTSGTVRSTVNLTAQAYSGLPAGISEVSDTEVGVQWVNIGDQYTGGYYYLDVQDADGSLADYPCAVKAADEHFTVTDLEPETQYFITVSSRTMKSERLAVTTVAPIPSVDILYDGDLCLQTVPGVPSEPAELLLDIDYITDPITITVDEPFELSVNHMDWGRSVTVTDGEDRIYVRIYGNVGGTYTSTLTVTAGSYFNDQASVKGIISSSPTFEEDFEPAGQSTYNPFTYQGSASTWLMNNAGMWSSDPVCNGKQSVRMGKSSTSSITMDQDKDNGVGTVEFWGRNWSDVDGNAEVALEYSTDKGATWNEAGRATVSGSDYKPYSFVVNKPGSVRLRVAQKTGQRWLLDDLRASDFQASMTVEPDGEVHSWDAWCYQGTLFISTSIKQPMAVYALDGTVLLDTLMLPGTIQLDLPCGLYIVANNGWSRRVLVK